MSPLDNFIKNYDKDHYKHYPKAKIVIRVFYAVSAVVIVLLIIRAVRMMN